VSAAMQELAKRFPKGLQYAIVYNTTTFVRTVDRSTGVRKIPNKVTPIMPLKTAVPSACSTFELRAA